MEDTTQLIRRCSQCGTALADDEPGDLCRGCASDSEMQTVLSKAGGAAGVVEPPRLEPGQTFGPYRVIRLLGRGGMGEVYEAEHGEHGRRVALKVLNSQLRSTADRARFLSEGQLAASISHPHAVYIYGSEEIDGRPVISMELLPGGTLKDRVVAEGPLPPAEAVSAILEVIDGLEAANAVGILHRDIKPSNCFNDHDGTVKVGDFGLSISTLARKESQQSGAGGFEGTPQFAAPEQLRGQPLDVRADIYAVGATLYYLLTGRPPFESRDLGELVRSVTTAMPASPRQFQAAVPAGLAAVVLKCLAKDAKDRPASYAELSEALRPFSARQDVPAPLGLRLMAGLVDALIVGVPASFLDTSEQIGLTFSTEPSSGSSFHVNPWAWVLGVAYFLAVEGQWGASLGKRVFGLRLSSAGNPPSWTQVGVRTVIYNFSGMLTAVPVFLWGMSAVESWVLARPVVALLATLMPVLLTAGLFLPARRRNGWAAIQDRASGTRVVWRVRQSARTPGQVEEAAVPASAGSVAAGGHVGPFEIISDLGATADGRLLLGTDPILHRSVWIHAVAPGTPPVSAARRDVRRPGRLHWLAGQRSADSNWDAFEAPDGAPVHDTRVPWSSAKMMLVELAEELAASVKEHTLPHLATSRVWTRKNGRAVLLDFPAPGAGTKHDDSNRTPVELLAGVAQLQLGSRDAMPTLPLPAASLFADWTSGRLGTLEDARARLTSAARLPDGVPRFRRALPIAMAGLPVVMLTMAAILAIRAVRTFATPENIEIVGLLTTLPDRPPGTRIAIETYLAGRYRDTLTSDDFWSDIVMRGNFSKLRAPADALLAAHPAVTDEDMQRISIAVQPEVERAAAVYTDTIAPRLAQSGSMIVGVLGAVFLIFAVFNAVCSAVIVRGGVISRLMGLAAVSRDGREIGRGRSVLRAIVAWSPAMAWLATLGTSPIDYVTAGHPGTLIGLALALGAMAVGAAWTIATPGQGPADRICRTWVVLR